MKRAVHPVPREEILRDYPIENADAPGWYFREREVSPGCYEAEGRDAYGRSVARSGIARPPLSECIADAMEINRRLQKREG